MLAVLKGHGRHGGLPPAGDHDPLIKHLHGFVREVQLTEAEFHEMTALINRIGQHATDTHNEAAPMAGS